MNEEKIHELMSWKYDGDFIFAFDNIEDSEVIQNKLQLFKDLYPKSKRKNKFYVFCGFDVNAIYDEDFWVKDLENLFKRIFILAKYGALPYVMRFEKTYSSSHKKIYNAIAGWCNQPSIFRKFSFAMFCRCHGMGKLYTNYKRDWERYIKEGNPIKGYWKLLDEDKYKSLMYYMNIYPEDVIEK